MKIIVFTSFIYLFFSFGLGSGLEAEAEYKGKVFEVNSRNALHFLSPQEKTQGILLEFYAPWCGACANFRAAYHEVAEELTLAGQYRVGACDIVENAAMAGRFDVNEIPALYLYKDGNLHKYAGAVYSTAVKNWATTEYASTKPLPYLMSPLGPFGRLKGLLIHTGTLLVDVVPRVSAYFGLPDYMGAVGVAVLLGLSILACTFLGVFVSVSHAKQD